MYYQQQPYRPNYGVNQQFTTTQGLKGHPVSSIEEARAAVIDFDGSLFFFPDLANNRIYTKQINMDGTASINMFELKSLPMDSRANSENFVTRDEFTSTISSLHDLITNALEKTDKEEEKKTEFDF